MLAEVPFRPLVVLASYSIVPLTFAIVSSHPLQARVVSMHFLPLQAFRIHRNHALHPQTIHDSLFPRIIFF